MKTFLARSGLLVLSLLAGTTLVAAKSPRMDVKAARDLNVVVIDSSKRDAARESLHKAFSTSLAQELAKRCGGPVPIRLAVADAQRAGFGLAQGVYDAAVIVGGDVPSALRSNSNFTVLRAAPESGGREKTVNLILRNEDPSLQELLKAAFPGTLSDQRFQDALARRAEKLTAKAKASPEGTSLAAASP